LGYQLHFLRYGMTTEIVELACAYDECAKAAALARCAGRDAQVWQGDRLVVTLVPAPKGKQSRRGLMPDCPYR
jgi:hypothetical protein